MFENKLSKKLIGLVMAVMLLASLAACAGNNNTNTNQVDANNNANDTSESSETPQELIIGENVDLGGYDPVKDMSPFVRFLVFDSLVELDYNYEKVPALATDWEMSEDGKTWTFELREGVTFHDGEPFNAEAAKTTFRHRIEAGTTGFYGSIDRMETPDEYTFVVHLSEPIFTFSSDIAIPSHGIVSPNAFNDDHEVTEAIGTGPFILEDWTKDVEFTMTANEDFYNGAPILDKLIFKVIVDGDTRALALESGQIDMMSGRNALTSLETLKSKDDIQVLKTMGQTSEMVMINTFDDVLSDLNVRKAIAASVDFASAVPMLLTDLAEPAENFFSPVFGEFVDPALELPQYDPEAGQAYLEEAGYELSDDQYYYKDGEKLSLSCQVVSNNEEDKALAAVMQEELKDNGIHMEITMMDEAAIRDNVAAHDFQLVMLGQSYVPTDDPSFHYKTGYYHSESINNLYSTPELDEKIDELFYSLDKEERLKLHKELQKEIMEQIPVLMMFHRNNVILANTKVKDFEVAEGTWQIFKGLEQARIE